MREYSQESSKQEDTIIKHEIEPVPRLDAHLRSKVTVFRITHKCRLYPGADSNCSKTDHTGNSTVKFDIQKNFTTTFLGTPPG